MRVRAHDVLDGNHRGCNVVEELRFGKLPEQIACKPFFIVQHGERFISHRIRDVILEREFVLLAGFIRHDSSVGGSSASMLVFVSENLGLVDDDTKLKVFLLIELVKVQLFVSIELVEEIHEQHNNGITRPASNTGLTIRNSLRGLGKNSARCAVSRVRRATALLSLYISDSTTAPVLDASADQPR